MVIVIQEYWHFKKKLQCSLFNLLKVFSTYPLKQKDNERALMNVDSNFVFVLKTQMVEYTMLLIWLFSTTNNDDENRMKAFWVKAFIISSIVEFIELSSLELNSFISQNIVYISNCFEILKF